MVPSRRKLLYKEMRRTKLIILAIFPAMLKVVSTRCLEKCVREAQQIIRQFELDQDEDGFKFYLEQEAGTSDQDPNDKPEK